MTWVDWLVAGLATWRLSHILLYENGPWRVFRRIRERLGVVYYDHDGNEVGSYKYEITTCMWCLSVWTGLSVVIVSHYAPIVLAPFAVSTLAIVLNMLVRKVG